MRGVEGDIVSAYSDAVSECMRLFRVHLGWMQVYTDGEFQELLERCGAGLASGEFFATRLGRLADGDPTLAVTLLVMRQRLIEEYSVTGMAELLLVDQVMIDVYHATRMHEMLCVLESYIDVDIYKRGTPHTMTTAEQDQLVQDLQGVSDRITPSLVRIQDALRRNLRELRRGKL